MTGGDASTATPLPARRIPRAAAPALAALTCCALALGALSIMGYDIRAVLRVIWQKAILPGEEYRRWARTLADATPILLTGLAVMVAFRTSALNIGAQGQYIAGAICAAAIATRLPLPASRGASIAMILIASIVGGAAWAALASLLELWRKVPLVLSTLLLNFIAGQLLVVLLTGPLRAPGGVLRTELLPAHLRLPVFGDSDLHLGFLLAIGAAAGVGVLMSRTTCGFRMRAVGENATAARFAGMHPGRIALLAMALSGALAGLAGGIELTGRLFELYEGASGSGYGFTGIAVALLGRLTARGVVLAALFFGLMNTAFRALEAELAVPFVAAQAFQGAIILALLILFRRNALNPS